MLLEKIRLQGRCQVSEPKETQLDLIRELFCKVKYVFDSRFNLCLYCLQLKRELCFAALFGFTE